MKSKSWVAVSCPLDNRQANPAAPKNGDSLAGLQARGSERRADAGQHPAADEGGAVQRDLRIDFDDVRTEEWTPSYAGAAARMDFVMKDERIVVEVKKTRDSLSEKQLGEELIVDIAKYKEYPGCDFLVCFVYDPERRLGNPKGLEGDLSRKEDRLTVEAIVVQ